jgi:hypothetical protein
MSNAASCYHVELLRIREDGSIDRRRFPPPFPAVSYAVSAAEDYIRGTEFWFRVVDDHGNPATPETNAIRPLKEAR